MRLIDADKLYEKRFTTLDIIGTVPVYRAVVKVYDVKNAPTVKAIPIEWILNHPKFPHNNENRKKCILDMIADWEKENE